ncbi:MAG: ABC transporter permease [Marmoricola sp.]
MSFTPAPGSAPLLGKVLTQARMEARLMLRNGEQLLLAIVIPVIVLLATVWGASKLGVSLPGAAVDVFTPGVLALAVLSTAFTSVAVATGFERRYGVIKRLGASPLSRPGLLVGKVLALAGVQVLQFVVIGGVGLALGWQPHWHPGAVLLALLGTAAFASLGLFIAGTLRAEATLAVANLIFLLLMAAGGVVLPTATYGAFGRFAELLPSGALGEGLREVFLEGHLNWSRVVVLVVWAMAGAVLTARTFKWE